MKENVAPSSPLSPTCPKSGISLLEKEVSNLYLPLSDEDDQHLKAREAAQPPKPFASFGSFRQRHGDVPEYVARTVEAPAKLESSTMAGSVVSEAFSHHEDSNARPSRAIDCGQPLTSKPPSHQGKLYHRGKSCSTDLDREAAWERKKEQYLLEEEDELCDGDEEYDADEGFYDDLCENELGVESPSESANEVDDVDNLGKGKSSVEDDENDSDVGHANVTQLARSCSRKGVYSKKKSMSMSRPPIKPLSRTRTRSLTDEDMDELRGSIDLGFGFSYNERSNLTDTLPALELYYAINRNLADSKSRSSPVSPLDGNVLLRTHSAGSTSSPSHDTWRVSSPGDHPSQVKTRLRHWAQAVACSVKQGY